MVKVAVLGYGTVGAGIVEVLDINKEVIKKKAGKEIIVKYILDLKEFPGDLNEKLVVHDFETILNDPEVEVVAEAMGGIEPAYTFAKKALTNGKSFCTSNKELVAKHGPELIALARENNENFLFEASVGGGIPLIRPLCQALTADDIYSIEGILNGTTNFILTKMDKEGLDFDVVLKEAQDKGYAERNPEADVEGYDACRKIAILGSLAFGNHIDFEDVYTEGITKITKEDFLYANELGRSIKISGSVKKEDGKYFSMVSPVMVSEENPLYAVNDVFNAVVVSGNVVDDVMFYGKGAGKLPTASAVVSDIVEEVQNLHRNIYMKWDSSKLNLSDYKKEKRQFFVRISGDAAVKFEEIKKIAKEVEIELVEVQKLKGEFGIVTGKISEYEYDEIAKQIDGIITRIRLGK